MSKCAPSGSCWCMDVPYTLKVEGDKCLKPKDFLEKIKKEYNLSDEKINELNKGINEKSKDI